MTEVKLPEYKEGCDADPKKVACAYPHTPLQKYLNADFAKNGGKAAAFLKKFKWTTEEQNEVSLMIADQKMSPEDGGEEVGRRAQVDVEGVAPEEVAGPRA